MINNCVLDCVILKTQVLSSNNTEHWCVKHLTNFKILFKVQELFIKEQYNMMSNENETDINKYFINHFYFFFFLTSTATFFIEKFSFTSAAFAVSDKLWWCEPKQTLSIFFYQKMKRTISENCKNNVHKILWIFIFFFHYLSRENHSNKNQINSWRKWEDANKRFYKQFWRL